MNLVTHHTATPPTVTNALLPRLTLLVSPKDHHGKTFLALYLASIFPGIVFVEADSGAPTLRQALVGDRTCEPVDLEHKSAPAQLDGWLAHVGGGAVMVDNASRATPARLNEIIGQVHARTTLLCVMEENRPGTEAYVRELRQAVGGNADWLLVRNQRREPQRFIQDTEDWTESPVRLNYQRAGGREVYLPVAHPRLFAATNRLPRPLDPRPGSAVGLLPGAGGGTSAAVCAAAWSLISRSSSPMHSATGKSPSINFHHNVKPHPHHHASLARSTTRHSHHDAPHAGRLQRRKPTAP